MGRRLVVASVLTVALIAPPAVADFGAAVAPELTGAKLSPKRFKTGSGTTFSWQASEPVEVGIRIEKRIPPTRPGGTATFKRVTLLVRNVPAGAGSLRFSGRVRGKPLKPGAYRAIVRASDAFDNKSEATTLAFRILAR